MNVNTKHEWVNLNFSQILTKRRQNLKLQKMCGGGGGFGGWELGTGNQSLFKGLLCTVQ